MQFAGRPLEDDVSPGDWIAPTLRPFDEHVVGSLVPPVFDEYESHCVWGGYCSGKEGSS